MTEKTLRILLAFVMQLESSPPKHPKMKKKRWSQIRQSGNDPLPKGQGTRRSEEEQDPFAVRHQLTGAKCHPRSEIIL